jgi:hypothetical protein
VAGIRAVGTPVAGIRAVGTPAAGIRAVGTRAVGTLAAGTPVVREGRAAEPPEPPARATGAQAQARARVPAPRTEVRLTVREAKARPMARVLSVHARSRSPILSGSAYGRAVTGAAGHEVPRPRLRTLFEEGALTLMQLSPHAFPLVQTRQQDSVTVVELLSPPAMTASSRGRSGFRWFLMGVLFGPFGLLVAAMPRVVEKEKARRPIQRKGLRYYPGIEKKCPFCGEMIKNEAIKCKHFLRCLKRQRTWRRGESCPRATRDAGARLSDSEHRS